MYGRSSIHIFLLPFIFHANSCYSIRPPYFGGQMFSGLVLDVKRKSGLIIPDMHQPYSHPDWLKFIELCKYKYCDNDSFYVCLGDEVDNHAISFHDSDADLMSAGDELNKAIKKLKELEKIIPQMYLLESNHGSLAIRRFKHHGIPLKYLKDIKEVYDTPSWEWHHEIILKTTHGDIYLCHGKSGTYGKLAKEQGMSSIQGHFHGLFEITWHRSSTFDRFNCFSGCLVDWNSLAMAYGKNNIPKPILGLTRISKSGYPHLIKMEINPKTGRWTGDLP